VYGALHRHPPAALLLVLLAVSTTVVALTDGRATFTVLLFVSGLFCAPTITATIDELSRSVPARIRGEAMGWHGSSMTLGGAAGAPIVGWAIDHGGWQGGFELAGWVGLAMALAGLAVTWLRRQPSGVAGEGGVDLAGGLGPVQRVEVQPGSAAGE
jgi:predicted MFS family arabinose efflux permease